MNEEINRKARMLKAENIINKGIKNKQYLRQTIFTYLISMDNLYRGINNRKIQNIKDHNLISIFKEDYPKEFREALNKYEQKYGKMSRFDKQGDINPEKTPSAERSIKTQQYSSDYPMIRANGRDKTSCSPCQGTSGLVLNQELLDREITIQKKTIAGLFHNFNNITEFTEIELKINGLKRAYSEICLVVADFKCQNPNCKSEHNLQYHHLIPRRAKEYMDKIRYISARYYWSNIIILCNKCHYKYHTDNHLPLEEEEKNELVIQQKTIDRIKNKYFIQPEEQNGGEE